jgi:hypothetical protein
LVRGSVTERRGVAFTLDQLARESMLMTVTGNRFPRDATPRGGARHGKRVASQGVASIRTGYLQRFPAPTPVRVKDIECNAPPIGKVHHSWSNTTLYSCLMHDAAGDRKTA